MVSGKRSHCGVGNGRWRERERVRQRAGGGVDVDQRRNSEALRPELQAYAFEDWPMEVQLGLGNKGRMEKVVMDDDGGTMEG